MFEVLHSDEKEMDLIFFKNKKYLVTNDKMKDSRQNLAPAKALFEDVRNFSFKCKFFRILFYNKSKYYYSGNLKFIFWDVSSNLFRKKVAGEIN